MAKVRRKAEIEIFKLEREREINYVKAKSEHHNSTDKLNDQSDTASVASAKTDGEQNSSKFHNFVTKNSIISIIICTYLQPTKPQSPNSHVRNIYSRLLLVGTINESYFDILFGAVCPKHQQTVFGRHS